MANYYADSSMAVKGYVHETGSTWVRRLLAPSAGHSISTSWITVVEVYSALTRRIRESLLSQADYTVVSRDFRSRVSTQYQMIPLTVFIVERARPLLERHVLRAYDAVQLASALRANAALVRRTRPELTFLSADRRLLAATQAEGLAIDDPNAHP